jgi:enamine deaminase RidA (YjgF/YER057c/UK114 family)
LADNIRRNNPDSVHKPMGYTHAVEVRGGRTVYVSGQVALDRDGKLVGPGDMRAQTVQVFENLRSILASLGGDFGDVVKLTYYVLDAGQVTIVREVRQQVLDAERLPASTFVEVGRLAREDFLVEIEAIAVLSE